MEKDDRLNLDDMVIVSKYFETKSDFLNIVRLNKKYKGMLECYKYNPISDYRIFKNMRTQHIYKEEDFHNRKEGLYRYVVQKNVEFNPLLKDNDAYITQTKRLWHVYLSLPSSSYPTSEYKGRDYINSNATIEELDDMEIIKIFTDNRFSHNDSILNDMNGLLLKIKEELKSNSKKKVFEKFKAFKDYIRYKHSVRKKRITNDIVYSSENFRLENRIFYKVDIDLDTGFFPSRLHEDDHYYLVLDENIVFKEESFPKKLLENRIELDLDSYGLAYDTFLNPIEKIEGKAYHVDTTAPFGILSETDCIIYIEESGFPENFAILRNDIALERDNGAGWFNYAMPEEVDEYDKNHLPENPKVLCEGMFFMDSEYILYDPERMKFTLNNRSVIKRMIILKK